MKNQSLSKQKFQPATKAKIEKAMIRSRPKKTTENKAQTSPDLWRGKFLLELKKPQVGIIHLDRDKSHLIFSSWISFTFYFQYFVEKAWQQKISLWRSKKKRIPTPIIVWYDRFSFLYLRFLNVYSGVLFWSKRYQKREFFVSDPLFSFLRHHLLFIIKTNHFEGIELEKKQNRYLNEVKFFG